MRFYIKESMVIGMEKKDLEYFRKLLNEQLHDLITKADDTVTDLLTFSDSSADLVDRASMDLDRNFNLRIRDRESKLIRKIRQALESIEDGSYGICEMCGEDISIARLEARPVTTYCIQCKTKKEAMERVTLI